MALALAACTGTAGLSGAEGCIDDSECGSGAVCEGGQCRQVCRADEDCAGGDEICENSTCVKNPSAECENAADCLAPAKCESTDGASCRGGKCEYTAKICHTPPAPECATTSTYRVYNSTGACDPATGGCVYQTTDSICPSCQEQCLHQCPPEGCGAPPEECNVDADCDDQQICTVDLCSEHACRHEAKTGMTCDDGNVCTVSDACSSAGVCAGVSATPKGQWSAWSGWSACSAACLGGTRTRSRTCSSTMPATCGAVTCSGSASESQDCNPQACSVNILNDTGASCQSHCAAVGRPCVSVGTNPDANNSKYTVYYCVNGEWGWESCEQPMSCSGTFQGGYFDETYCNCGGLTATNATTYMYNGVTDLSHALGHADGDDWVVTTAEGKGHMVYGPYKSWGRGRTTVTFRVKLTTTPSSNEVLALDVVTGTGGTTHAERTLYPTSFKPAGTWQDFTLVVTPNYEADFEARGYTWGRAGMELGWIVVTTIP
ncbi:MAG: thrombospondin type-1 domain-containing protein [Deltaproteobacteria bacterium]|nr:thrombospondin type-1 domain-containing protein [Deltaproteobacteria bacterium]